VRTRLYDPRHDDPAVTVEVISWPARPRDPERTNTFSIYWIESGAGTIDVDLTTHAFSAQTLLFVSPYRRIRFTPSRPVGGAVVRFHANYLCIETFHAESGCSGALFNDPFGSPVVSLPAHARADVRHLLRRVADELETPLEGAEELVIASLKILLVLATRLKSASNASRVARGDYRHPLTHRVSELVEQHYRDLHAPAGYARLLNMTPKALGRLTKTHFGRTMTEIVRERLLIDAKWDLLHTLKPVKQIASELGFGDELYFSRFFKKATGRAPTAFREFETEIRGGSNLSMSLARPAIPVIPSPD
jgi:AraC-like DNA-binding protein